MYCVTITDANSCTVVACRTLTDPPLLALSAVITEATCNQHDGAIDLTVTNGTVAFIIWAPGGYITEDLTNWKCLILRLGLPAFLTTSRSETGEMLCDEVRSTG